MPAGLFDIDFKSTSSPLDGVLFMFFRSFSIVTTLIIAPLLIAQSTRSAANVDPDPAQVAELVVANHILADQGLLDAFGHVSVRDTRNPNRYLMSRAVPAAMVTAADIFVYDLDSNPVKGNTSDSFWERYIHGEIYKARPDVMAVIHSHASDVLPFSVTQVPLRPMIHTAAFMPQTVRVFDNRPVAGMTDLLISTPALGHALAEMLGSDPLILLRGHGVAVVGPSLHIAVARTYYMTLDARAEQQAIALGGRSVTYLTPEEAEKGAPQKGGFERAWELWESKIEKKK